MGNCFSKDIGSSAHGLGSTLGKLADAAKRNGRSVLAGALISPCMGLAANAAAQEAPASILREAPDSRPNALYGPGGIYMNIPARDEFGRDQLAMFREWNPDPLGHHETNMRALHPLLARVVRKAEADNPGLSFVIGSGKRDPGLQRRAFSWGWSKTRDSHHQSGEAVDLWPLDSLGRVTFDPASLARIGAAMKKAAGELGVPIRWGGNFQSFKDRDRSHFELALP